MVNLSRYDMTTSILYLILAYGMTAASVRRETGRRLFETSCLPCWGS